MMFELVLALVQASAQPLPPPLIHGIDPAIEIYRVEASCPGRLFNVTAKSSSGKISFDQLRVNGKSMPLPKSGAAYGILSKLGGIDTISLSCVGSRLGVELTGLAGVQQSRFKAMVLINESDFEAYSL